MAVDLHLHSTFSDGTYSPSQIVARAADIGLTGIALTDHDTLAGVPEATSAARQRGLRFVPGTELSVRWRDQRMHLLVYFLEPGLGPLQDRMAALRQSRAERNMQIASRLQQLGVEVTMDEVTAEAGGGVVGRPHFAGVLIRKGYVSSVPEAFDRYLARGRPAYADRMRLIAAEAIGLSRASGAIPVVAHPHTLNMRAEEFAGGFGELVECGLGGIESYYGEYPPQLRQKLAAICAALGIVATGGSDFHGRYKPGLEIGTGTGDLRVPDEVLDQLDQARGSPPLSGSDGVG